MFKKILQITAVKQPNDPKYYWVYGLGDDNNMYVWHEQRAVWDVHSKNKKRIQEITNENMAKF